MNLPDADIVVVVTVRPDAPLLVDEMPTALVDLTPTLDEIVAGRRARIEVLVWPPASDLPGFVAYVRAVQEAVRAVRHPVGIGFRRMTETTPV